MVISISNGPVTSACDSVHIIVHLLYQVNLLSYNTNFG